MTKRKNPAVPEAAMQIESKGSRSGAGVGLHVLCYSTGAHLGFEKLAVTSVFSKGNLNLKCQGNFFLRQNTILH